VKLSPIGAQPGTLTTGTPNEERYSLPRKSIRLIEPVMLPAAAGIPPHVAQVPIATHAAAPGASWTSQSVIRVGRPPDASLPSAEK
jgi:hypothetical protein